MVSAMSEEQRDLLYLFERPSDPLYMPRGPNNSVVYNVSSPNMPAGFRPRFGGSSSNVINVRTDGGLASSLSTYVRNIPRNSPFSLNFREHRQAAKEIIQILKRAGTVAELRDIASSIREEVNEMLFIYSLSFVVTRNKAFKSFRIPAIYEMFPSHFIDGTTLDAARTATNREQSNQNTNRNEPMVLNHDQDFTGFRKRPENRVAYWREDYGLNAHHWHWHLVFPSEVMDATLERPDRKGEIFFYMHQQILARFDMERMSIGLPRVVRMDGFRGTIRHGYFPKLRFDNVETNPNRRPLTGLHPSATLWGSRQDNTPMANYTRVNTIIPVDLAQLELWHNRIMDGIHLGYFLDPEGNRVPLSDEVDITDGSRKRGVDIIGDALEADPGTSVNYQYYGDLHNFAHFLIASVHDPDGTHGENLGVMGGPATSMRDPVFFNFHKYVDWVFQQYKDTQPSYTLQQLSLAGVTITRLGVATGNVADELHTGWNYRQIEASRGIDFGTAQSVRVNLQHLDNKPFDFHILANNETGRQKQVYVRVFLAPKFNQNGEEMNLNEQRILWAEMDKFVYTLQPGQNHIRRASTESSLTIPEELTFRQLEEGLRDPSLPQTQEDFCGCGWPQHLLVPRGKPEGMVYQLFVMMTDYEEDRVPAPSAPKRCARAASFCGIRDSRYPDKRPMGFPFDRLPPRELRTPQEQVVFISDLARLQNMAVHDITIRFLADQLNPPSASS